MDFGGKKSIIAIIIGVIAFWSVLGFAGSALYNSIKDRNYVEIDNLNLNSGDDDSSFEDDDETSLTRCLAPGCKKRVAPGGESDYCPAHSNKCLKCGKYIDRHMGCCSSCAQDILDEISDDDTDYYNYNYDKHKCYNYNYDDHDYYNYDYDDYDDYDYEYDEYDYDDYYDY